MFAKPRENDARMTNRILLASLVTLTTLNACALRRSTNEVDNSAVISSVTLEVENHNWSDVTLYVIHDGVQTRIGQVTAAQDLAIDIPASLQGQMHQIQLAARRIGGNDAFVSQQISLRGNAAIRFTIESDLRRSTVGVW